MKRNHVVLVAVCLLVLCIHPWMRTVINVK
jgi:hypothetical protein